MTDDGFDLEKYRSIGHLSRGRTRDRVVDGRRPNGERMKSTTDQLGNTVTESSEQQDVHIRAETIRISREEIRDVAK